MLGAAFVGGLIMRRIIRDHGGDGVEVAPDDLDELEGKDLIDRMAREDTEYVCDLMDKVIRRVIVPALIVFFVLLVKEIVEIT